MNFREYFSLADDASLRDLKRAYAKNLKITSPETDAEGFQYLRTVYEYALANFEEPSTLAAPFIAEQEEFNVPPVTSTPEKNIEEILRCLSNNMETQAIVYLELMRDEGELQSLELSTVFELRINTYLDQLSTGSVWPANFVRLFVSALQLSERAQTDEMLNKRLSYFYQRTIMVEDDLTAEEYHHQERAKSIAEHALAEICAAYVEKGQEHSRGALEYYSKQGVFGDSLSRRIFLFNYIKYFNDYFPTRLPYELIVEINKCLAISQQDNIDFAELKTAFGNYRRRLKAGDMTANYIGRMNQHPNTVAGIAWQMIYGFVYVPEAATVKSHRVYQEIKKILVRLETKDEFFLRYEVGGEEGLEPVRNWVEGIENLDVNNFHTMNSGSRANYDFMDVVKSFFSGIFQNAVFVGLAIFMLLMLLIGISSSIEKHNYLEIMKVIGSVFIVAFVPIVINYLWRCYVGKLQPYKYKLRHYLHVNDLAHFALQLVLIIGTYFVYDYYHSSPVWFFPVIFILPLLVLLSSLSFMYKVLICSAVPAIILAVGMDALEMSHFGMQAFLLATWGTYIMYRGTYALIRRKISSHTLLTKHVMLITSILSSAACIGWVMILPKL